MGKNSKVEWTDHTWGPWYGGCEPRGPECANCYARRDMRRYGRDPDVLTRSKTMFNAPLKWKEPAKIFVCSWSDFFLKDADSMRNEAWDVMRNASQHTYIIPTKRPELIMDRLPDDWGDGWPNVWLLVSAGTQESADKWIPELLRVPAVVHGVSCEPLLESVDLRIWLRNENDEWSPLLSWIVAGGESGPKARPMHPDSARRLRDHANLANVPFHFKQWGEYKEIQFDKRERGDVLVSPLRGIIDELPDPFESDESRHEYKHIVAMRRIGKKAAGRILDGRTWDEFPEMKGERCRKS